MKIKIYADTSADISKIKKTVPSYCEFYQFPYDSPDRPKKKFLLAKPSDFQWHDGHISWDELSDITWDDFQGSPLYPEIKALIGPENRRDVLHFDSAYKTECKVFLTEDKCDIWSKREALENLTGIKTFCTSLELEMVIQYLKLQRSMKTC